MRTISRQELVDWLDSDEWDGVLIDVLPEESFRDVHAAGAINVPLGDEFERRVRQAAPDKVRNVVLYCGSSQCPASQEAALKMEEMGYSRVFVFKGGLDEWQRAGLPLEGEKVEAPAFSPPGFDI
ncbi:MAG: rhodanese-like domain-containing protein [Planctomycetaceae bacterium]|nr:rhodanese-like domain-containing protein [Planctomycetaceae bacterium]